MRVYTTPWVRGAMTDKEQAWVAALRGEANGTLSLLAGSPRGPFTARLSIPGYDEIRHDGPTLAGVLRAALASVEAIA